MVDCFISYRLQVCITRRCATCCANFLTSAASVQHPHRINGRLNALGSNGLGGWDGVLSERGAAGPNDAMGDILGCRLRLGCQLIHCWLHALTA